MTIFSNIFVFIVIGFGLYNVAISSKVSCHSNEGWILIEEKNHPLECDLACSENGYPISGLMSLSSGTDGLMCYCNSNLPNVVNETNCLSKCGIGHISCDSLQRGCCGSDGYVLGYVSGTTDLDVYLSKELEQVLNSMTLKSFLRFGANIISHADSKMNCAYTYYSGSTKLPGESNVDFGKRKCGSLEGKKSWSVTDSGHLYCYDCSSDSRRVTDPSFTLYRPDIGSLSFKVPEENVFCESILDGQNSFTCASSNPEENELLKLNLLNIDIEEIQKNSIKEKQHANDMVCGIGRKTCNFQFSYSEDSTHTLSIELGITTSFKTKFAFLEGGVEVSFTTGYEKTWEYSRTYTFSETIEKTDPHLEKRLTFSKGTDETIYRVFFTFLLSGNIKAKNIAMSENIIIPLENLLDKKTRELIVVATYTRRANFIKVSEL